MRSPRGGEAGVAHVLKLIDAEMRVAMALTGCTQHRSDQSGHRSNEAAIRRRSEERRHDPEQAVDVGRGHRLREQEALHRRAAVGAQLHQLRGFLDAFGRRLDVRARWRAR